MIKEENKQMETEVKVNLETARTLAKKTSKVEQLSQFTKEKISLVDKDKGTSISIKERSCVFHVIVGSYEEKREEYKGIVNDLVNLSIEAGTEDLNSKFQFA